VALQIYAGDFSGRLPAVTNAPTSEAPLSLLVPRYTVDTSIFICPGGKATEIAFDVPAVKERTAAQLVSALPMISVCPCSVQYPIGYWAFLRAIHPSVRLTTSVPRSRTTGRRMPSTLAMSGHLASPSTTTSTGGYTAAVLRVAAAGAEVRVPASELALWHAQAFNNRIDAAVTATFLGFLIGPRLIARLRRLKFGQNYDDSRTGDLATRFDKKNTPTMGGLLIFFSVFLTLVKARWLLSNLTAPTANVYNSSIVFS